MVVPWVVRTAVLKAEKLADTSVYQMAAQSVEMSIRQKAGWTVDLCVAPSLFGVKYPHYFSTYNRRKPSEYLELFHII